jgi:hypothetical protein
MKQILLNYKHFNLIYSFIFSQIHLLDKLNRIASETATSTEHVNYILAAFLNIRLYFETTFRSVL